MISNYRKLHDEIREVLAHGLYYINNIERINKLETAAEVTEAISGGISEYRRDPIYRAKVDMLTAKVLEVVATLALRTKSPEVQGAQEVIDAQEEA